MIDKIAKIKLGVNIDHVATLRNARGTNYPDPLEVAKILEKLNVDGITAHLREDRRHILDQDIENLVKRINLPLNLEMAATDEMQRIALKTLPNAVCLVPEKREERTTEGGLDVAKEEKVISEFVRPLIKAQIRVSLFISPDISQIEAAARIGVPVIELNTGNYCDFFQAGDKEEYMKELSQLKEATKRAKKIGLEVHGGHGLTFESVKLIASIPGISELNIGHFIISDSIFSGITNSVKNMRASIDRGQALTLVSAHSK